MPFVIPPPRVQEATPVDEDKAAETPLAPITEFAAPPGETGIMWRQVGLGSV